MKNNRNTNDLNEKKTVLITGASSGIGYEFSKLFAKDGYNLVIVARNEEKLKQLENELEGNFGISVFSIPKDLSVAATPQEIFYELQQESIEIDILVNNAGFNVYGAFSETNIIEELQMVQVNLMSLTHLTKLFLPGMLRNGYGKIMNIGSTGSFGPGPLNAVYCATKSFVLSFSEAIAEELQGTGITVTALCPGATKTEFFKRANMEDIKLLERGVMDAKTVAEIGYKAMMKGERLVIAGIENKLMIFLIRFMPRKMMAKMAKEVMVSDNYGYRKK
ncbi:MAG: SDR family oxidoreductase [Candidatus Methanoperedens sp.]|nr:SDR family oxidoreductase [Candidatus Methanoperedens sp.]